MTTVVRTSCGHGFAVRRATACSAIRGAFATRSHLWTNSHPAWFCVRPPAAGYERICSSPSPTASAEMPQPVSKIVCSRSLPSLERKSLSSRQIS